MCFVSYNCSIKNPLKSSFVTLELQILMPCEQEKKGKPFLIKLHQTIDIKKNFDLLLSRIAEI